MSKWIPFFKSYNVKCRDGTTKTIYKKADDAFPLWINGYEANISATLRAEILSTAGIDSNLKSKVEGLLYGLDEINNGLMMSFRSAYVGYQSDPCSNNQFLINQIEKINEEQRRLRTLKIQIKGFVELATNNPDDSTRLAEFYISLINSIGSSNLLSAGISEAIEISRNAAQALMEGNS